MSFQKNFATSFFLLSQVRRTKEWRHDAILGLKNSFCDKCDNHFLGITFNVFHFFATHSKIDYTSNSQYKRFLTQGQNFKITNSSTMKNIVAVVAVFFSRGKMA